ncbi:uncharacterized protein LOC127093840 [Lathyrus oleraceus]|uniref:uncharacterized protein LOC127093840 n=1 Tax=Pisum sativum TaxID=3888 RepID=UPI0021D2B5F3|nr:uncharacterized protein LOC127093840 [Pisum sativum]
MTYTELFPALIQKDLVQTRTPPAISKELLWWYKPDQHCEFHQRAPDRDIENCFTFKAEARRLMQSGILSFEDFSPNVQANPLPKHGNATVNMVKGYPRKYRVLDVNLIKRSLVEMHANLCELSYYENDHASCEVCSRDPQGCVVVKRDLQEMLDQNLIQVTRDKNEDEHEVNVIVPRFNLPEPVVIVYDGQKTAVSPLVICLEGPTPYESDKVVPYKYIATMVEDAAKRNEDVVIEKSTQAKTHVVQAGQSSSANQNVDQNEVLKLIKKSDFNVVDQLLHTLSKIFVLSLLMMSEARREALQKEDALSNMLVDTGSSLNVLPKSMMSKLAYQGAPMRFNGVIVKAFDGSRKTVSREVDLPIKIGPCLFQIIFQVMGIHPSYSRLLGRSWIHEVRAVTSTLHQKLKFLKNGKLVIVGGEQAMLVSHLSSFSYIDADETEKSFESLFVDNIAAKKNGESMSSLKDAQHVLKNGQSDK